MNKITDWIIEKGASILVISMILAIGNVIIVSFFDLKSVTEKIYDGSLIILLFTAGSALFIILYKHSLELKKQEHGQHFSLSATSHMAETAFDKHILFCEEYIFKLQEILKLIFKDGDPKKGFEYYFSLHKVKEKHRTWVTKSIEDVIKPLEGALWTMGRSSIAGSAKLADAYNILGVMMGDDTAKDEILDSLGISEKNESDYTEPEKQLIYAAGIQLMIQNLQDKLQIDKYVEMREAIVNAAHKSYLPSK